MLDPGPTIAPSRIPAQEEGRRS